MKAVMISIKPQWCGLIAGGKKTIEVRKSKPKLKTPFKVYIYCTKDGDTNGYQIFVKPKNANQFKGICTGTVIGEFVCDFITNLSIKYSNPDCKAAHKIFPYTGLTDKQIIDYLGNGKDGYGWHISDLVIYDKPKDLEEFCILDKEKQKQCAYRERYYVNPDLSNGAALKAGFTCNIGHEIDFCRPFDNTCPCFQVLHRPPQSWCYVERIGLKVRQKNERIER